MREADYLCAPRVLQRTPAVVVRAGPVQGLQPLKRCTTSDSLITSRGRPEGRDITKAESLLLPLSK